jgi:hypothetical protein
MKEFILSTAYFWFCCGAIASLLDLLVNYIRERRDVTVGDLLWHLIASIGGVIYLIRMVIGDMDILNFKIIRFKKKD